MFVLLNLKKSRLSALLLALQLLLCVFLLPTNGRPSFEDDDVDSAEKEEDQEKVLHQDQLQDEDWDVNDDEDDEAQNLPISPIEEDGKDPCDFDTGKDLKLRCLANIECCVSRQCRIFDKEDPHFCNDLIKLYPKISKKTYL